MTKPNRNFELNIFGILNKFFGNLNIFIINKIKFCIYI